MTLNEWQMITKNDTATVEVTDKDRQGEKSFNCLLFRNIAMCLRQALFASANRTTKMDGMDEALKKWHRCAGVLCSPELYS